jgi:hypothetical protein
MKRFLLPALVFACMGGCAVKHEMEKIEDIYCTLSFHFVEKAEEKEHIFEVIKKHATPQGDEALPYKARQTGPDAFECTFRVKNLDVLDALHTDLKFKKDPKSKEGWVRIVQESEQRFAMRYDSAWLTGKIKVELTFRISPPGARLFYRDEEGAEHEITDKVSPEGAVKLYVKIRRNQDYFYAKIVSGQLKRFIKVNIYTQEVSEITREEYEARE